MDAKFLKGMIAPFDTGDATIMVLTTPLMDIGDDCSF
jgi:hypothetical protein